MSATSTIASEKLTDDLRLASTEPLSPGFVGFDLTDADAGFFGAILRMSGSCRVRVVVYGQVRV